MTAGYDFSFRELMFTKSDLAQRLGQCLGVPTKNLFITWLKLKFRGILQNVRPEAASQAAPERTALRIRKAQMHRI